ncbi:MAG: response regulator transcription factor [Polyangia bacterium]
MSERPTILVIEDESDLVVGLKDAFGFEGYDVHDADDGERGIELAEQLEPDLVILDLMLPGMNGYHVCEELRRRDRVMPILILSALSQESEVVRGLEAGADDYVTKPFSVAELLARVRTIFRRMQVVRRRDSSTVSLGEAKVNVDAHTAEVDGNRIELSFYETAILALLDERRGEPVSRDEILDAVWGLDANPTNRTVDNFIMKLRRKLESDPSSPEHILTVYGQGYKLV